MEPSNKNNMEKDRLELVIQEFCQEQANNTKAIYDLVSGFNTLTDRVSQLREQVEKPAPASAVTDTRPIEQIVTKAVTDMKLIAGTRPAPVIRKIQFLLFPEQDAKLFYKIVFGRWFLFLVIMLFLANLYKWGIHDSDNRKEVSLRQAENDPYRQAWKQFYDMQDKSVKRLMDETYRKAIDSFYTK